MKSIAVVVIIAHKSVLTDAEKASLRQCYKVLGKHPIRLVCPEGLDVSVYHEVNPNAEIIFIDPKWQADYRMFNELKMSLFFYKMFRQYEFILFYELDAWVFRDELEYWCGKGYDYIGAPWFEGKATPVSRKIIEGGNGGFSLRSIKKANKILARLEFIIKFRRFWFDSKFQGIIPFLKIPFFKRFFKITTTEFLNELIFNWNAENEDHFWSYFIKDTFSDFTVAPTDDAIKFSFEVWPSYLYKLNENKQPFGCHAWEKYEPKFWEGKITIE